MRVTQADVPTEGRNVAAVGLVASVALGKHCPADLSAVRRPPVRFVRRPTLSPRAIVTALSVVLAVLVAAVVLLVDESGMVSDKVIRTGRVVEN